MVRRNRQADIVPNVDRRISEHDDALSADRRGNLQLKAIAKEHDLLNEAGEPRSLSRTDNPSLWADHADEFASRGGAARQRAPCNGACCFA